MQELKTARTWHPLAIAVYPPLAVYSQNLGEVGFVRVLPWLAIGLFVVGLAWGIGWFALKSPQRAALGASLAGLVFFGYGPLVSLRLRLAEAAPDNFFRIEALALIVVLLGAYAFYRALRRPGFLNGTTRFLNLASVALLAMLALSVVSGSARIWINEAAASNASASAGELDPTAIQIPADAELPDIYLIILDAYAGEDMLKDFYGYDNQPFLDALRGMGFHVQPLARSNFNATLLSLSSLLSMEYSLAPGPAGGTQPVEWIDEPENVAPVKAKIHSSRVIDALKKAGYHFTMFESGYEVTGFDTADTYLRPPWTLREFDSVALNQTILLPLIQWVGNAHGRIRGYETRKRVHFTLDTLKSIPDREEPNFVFAHVPCPHRPFVFRADGSARRAETEAEAPGIFVNAYVEQLSYLNGLVLDTVSAIRERSPDAIIILQGDHGPRHPEAPRSFSWHDRTRDFLGTLNAVYFPGENYDDLPATFSQVNTFRLVFNRYFGTEMEMLTDASYLRVDPASTMLIPLTWENGNAVMPNVAAARRD